MAGDDDFVVQVNTLHRAHVEGGAWAQIANRGHRVEEADIAGDHLGQHRLKDEIVLLIHEGNLDVGAAVQRFVQCPDRVYAPESAPYHENSLACCAPHSSSSRYLCGDIQLHIHPHLASHASGAACGLCAA